MSQDLAALAALLALRSPAEGAEGYRASRAAADAVKLAALARGIGRRAVEACNRPLTEAQQERAAYKDRLAYTDAAMIAARYGATIGQQEDTRGPAMRLLFPAVDGVSPANGFGQGWCVPKH